MDLSFEWVFPVLCLAMMALCFFTFDRRAGRRRRFNRSCFGGRSRERKSGSPEELEREVAWLQEEIDALRHKLNEREEAR